VPFLTRVAVRRVGSDRWELLEDLVYQGRWETITVPAGFRTDFASVPALTASLIPRTGPWDEAAVLHDYLCTDLRRYWEEQQLYLRVRSENGRPLYPHPRPPLVSARDADGLFRRIMREGSRLDGETPEDAVGPVTRWLMWTAVRWGAAGNPARRAGWWRDAPAVLGISLAVVLVVLAALAAVTLAAQGVAVAALLA